MKKIREFNPELGLGRERTEKSWREDVIQCDVTDKSCSSCWKEILKKRAEEAEMKKKKEK